MTYKGYQARVELDEEAGVFHGEVINTRDVITFQGSSVEKLKQAFEDSVDDYVEFCASRGEDPEKPVSTAEKLSALRTEDYFRERAMRRYGQGKADPETGWPGELSHSGRRNRMSAY